MKHDSPPAPERTTEPGPRVTVRDFVRDNRLLVAIIAAVLVVAFAVAIRWSRRGPASENGAAAAPKPASGDADDDRGAGEVALDSEALAELDLEIEAVTTRPAVAPLTVTGSVEPNSEREQQVISLVAGRVAEVRASLGDRVARGAVLATLESPQVADLQGQLHEAKAKLELAEANVARVKTTANRAGIVAARAKLDLARKTRDRQQRLVDLGVGARKELEAADAELKTAEAEYEFQSKVAIARDIAEAESDRATALAVVERLRQQLEALGATPDGRTPRVVVMAPVSGEVIRREVNGGAAVQEGTTLFAVSDTSNVWVVANVPESLVSLLSAGVPAEIRSALGEEPRVGRVSYVDPQVDDETHTARARVEIPNPGARLKVGMLVEVTFRVYPPNETNASPDTAEPMIPEAAVQRAGDRTFVFVPEDGEPGHFLVKAVQLGSTVNGYVRVLSGLEPGDKVVTKGAFALKSKLLKGAFGEDDDE